MTNDPQGS